MQSFSQVLAAHNLALQRTRARVLQLNIGKKCNQTCAHCHVNAGPARTESMNRETLERILSWLDKTSIPVVDITGGAPELNPHFRFLVERCREMKRHVMDRCNLTIFFEPGQEDLPEFLSAHQVEIVASLPCYGADNVDAQRGDGVFQKSVAALQRLNALGYGRDNARQLHLVYNPLGAHLPPPQSALQDDYKTRLREDFGIEFHCLFALANLPIARFAAQLRRDEQWDSYNQLLAENFNPATIDGLMCRDTINVDWQGRVYDCDFNQMLRMPRPGMEFLWEFSLQELEQGSVLTGGHCFGCTAGAGSSCGGALAN
jgi:radical SAM/Cys-rich protein